MLWGKDIRPDSPVAKLLVLLSDILFMVEHVLWVTSRFIVYFLLRGQHKLSRSELMYVIVIIIIIEISSSGSNSNILSFTVKRFDRTTLKKPD